MGNIVFGIMVIIMIGASVFSWWISRDSGEDDINDTNDRKEDNK